LLAEYLRAGAGQDLNTRAGLVAMPELRQRLREEMSRSDRTGRAFSMVTLSLGLRTPEQDSPSDAWRALNDDELARVGHLLRLTARDEDVLGLLDDGVMVGMLPDSLEGEAEDRLDGWERDVAALFDGVNDGASNLDQRTVRFAAGTCLYRANGFAGDREAVRVATQVAGRGASATSGPTPEKRGSRAAGRR